MRVLLYEPNYTGHHYAYLAHMLPGLLDLPVEPVLATTEIGIRSKEFSLTLAPFREHLHIETCCTPLPKRVWRNVFHRLRELVRAVRITRPDHVYILYADGIWELLALQSLLKRWPLRSGNAEGNLVVEAWLYRGGFTYPDATYAAAKIRRWLFHYLIGTGRFAAMHLDDELMFEFADQYQKNGGTRVILTPNPVNFHPSTSKTDARLRLGLAVDRRIVCSNGMVSHWKGMDRLIEAFRRHLARRGSAEDQLILAGPHTDDIRTMLSTAPYRTLVADGRLRSIDRYLTSVEMFDFAAASDLMVAASPRHPGRSSIILWSAAAGRPSLGTAWGCIGHVIRSEHLGLTCNVLDPDEFAYQLGEGLAIPWTETDVQRVRHYAEFHRIENYQRVATTLLRERVGVST